MHLDAPGSISFFAWFLAWSLTSSITIWRFTSRQANIVSNFLRATSIFSPALPTPINTWKVMGTISKTLSPVCTQCECRLENRSFLRVSSLWCSKWLYRYLASKPGLKNSDLTETGVHLKWGCPEKMLSYAASTQPCLLERTFATRFALLPFIT